AHAGGADRAPPRRTGHARPADDARARRQRRHGHGCDRDLRPDPRPARRAAATGRAVTRGPVFAGPGTRPAVEEITLDEPGANEVQVRVEACGVCHTDVHVVETGGWGKNVAIPPRTDSAGVVAEAAGGA